MRTILLIATLLLALATTSTVLSLPATCQDPCVVTAATPGYVSPTVSIDSGASVIFASIDVTHPTGEGFTSGAPCFIASTTAGHPAPPVRFDRIDGELFATTGDGDPQLCTSTQRLPTGEATLVFRCLLHPNMVGTIQVS